MGGAKKFNIKSRMYRKPQEKRYISFEDDLVFDVAGYDDKYNENQVNHVLLSLVKTIKNKAKDPECFVIATPIGEFYLKTLYMDKAKEAIASRILKGHETRKMRDKIRRFVYKLQIYKAQRSNWIDTFGLWVKGRAKKLYLHDQPSMSGTYPYSRQEREEMQNLIL